MKTRKRSTLNIQHSTPGVAEPEAMQIHESATARRKFDLENRLLEFTSAVIDLSESLPATRAGNHVAGQVLQSGTSPCPNHAEAEAAESCSDFIHKMKVCLKELRETRRWARLIQRKAWVKNETTLLFVLGECEELICIFHSSIQTAKRNTEAQARKPSNPTRYPSADAG